MNVGKVKKNIDYSKLNIGVEMECFIVHDDSLKEISREETQAVFKSLADTFNWGVIKANHIDEIQAIEKTIFNHLTSIKIDLCYAIFEITTYNPVDNLETLSKILGQTLKELREVLRQHKMFIWPFGVAPASSGLFNLPFKHKEELIDDLIYKPLRRMEILERYCHMTSHQINIDIPLNKLISAINALYKNLGNIINKFANSPLFINNKLYKEGRYHFWNDFVPELNSSVYMHGAKPIFPPKPFKNINDFVSRMWQGKFIFVIRNNKLYTFKDLGMSPKRFLSEKKGLGITVKSEEKTITLQKDDIDTLLHMNWLDFKPHFDLDSKYTLDEFLDFYNQGKIDDFMEKHCKHTYLEIRPCSPRLENNAMDIPTYFYNIFKNLDDYIKRAENINWKKAKKLRDNSLLA